MIDLDLEISKTTRNGDTNIWLNRRAQPATDSTGLTDDDLPF